MKKILCLLLIMCAFLLISCGGSSDNIDNPDVTDGGDVQESGKSLSEYVIVINDENYRANAIAFAKKLQKATGILLEVTDTNDEGKLAINYGTVSTENAWEYRVEAVDSDINLYGAGVAGACYASELFLTLIDEGGKISMEKELYCADVREKFLEGKMYAMQRIFGENGKFSDGGMESQRVYYASKTDVPSYIKDPIVIVFLGASNSEGGTLYFEKFAKAVAELLRNNVVYYNAGVGGTGTNLTAARFYQSAGQYEPDIIVLDDNSNDMGGSEEAHVTYVESIMYQIQQLPKVPVVIFNWIPRPNDIDSDIIEKTSIMLERKSSVSRHYGISHIDNYSAMRERWEAISADIAEKGKESEYYATFEKSLNNADLKQHKVFADYYDNYKWRNELPFLAYLTNYYNLTSVKDNVITYNVHPKSTGYELIGDIMVEKLKADPYRYLTNKVMPENFELSTSKYTKNSTVEYTLIGADGTVLGINAEEEKREITYVGDWTIYNKDNQFDAVKNDVNGGNADKIAFEKITMSSGLIYKTPYFANGIAQTYNASCASFSFKTTADEINFYIPISGVGLSATVTVTDDSGNVLNVNAKPLSCYEGNKQSYGRLRDWIALPSGDKEYTVTVKVDESDVAVGKYLFRFGYIIEKNYNK